MSYGRFCPIFLLSLVLLLPAAQAASYDDEIVPVVEFEDDALDKGEKVKKAETAEKVHPSDKSQADNLVQATEEEAAPAAKEEKDVKKVQRYVKILSDESGFVYYLDTQNIRWTHPPYAINERIVDVWVKLAQEDDTQYGLEEDEAYSYPKTYFMEHYYLRPDRQQIQFLSELEVTGRPQNAIKERPYSSNNWENLVPGSIEDEIYHAAMKYIKKQKGKSLKMTRHGENITVRDAVEEYLRISL